MKIDDILIKRLVNDVDGEPMFASPTRSADSVEELWEVTARAKEPATRHPFRFALETAQLWQEERGGDIYRQDFTDLSPVLIQKKV